MNPVSAGTCELALTSITTVHDRFEFPPIRHIFNGSIFIILHYPGGSVCQKNPDNNCLKKFGNLNSSFLHLKNNIRRILDVDKIG